MSNTPNLDIALIASNQASKEVTANQAFVQLDEALTQQLSHSMTDANYTLADNPPVSSEARYNMVFVFTGALTADRNIIVPSSEKLYIVSNQTSGGHDLLIKTASGSGVYVVNSGASSPFVSADYMVLYCDGTNVVPVMAPEAEHADNKDVASGYAGLDSNTKLHRSEILGHYTVVGLPTGAEGDLAYATNGRKVGEGVGTGTGVPVYFSNASWRVYSTDAAVAA